MNSAPWTDARILNAKWTALFEDLTSRSRVSDPARTLRIELLINMLTHIGQAGVDNHDIRRRLKKTERMSGLIMNNPLAQGTKSILRLLSSMIR